MRPVVSWFRTGYGRMWWYTVLPTSGGFFLAWLGVRTLYRLRLRSLVLAEQASHVLTFDAMFPFWYVLAGLLLTVLVSTAVTRWMAYGQIIRPYGKLIVLSKRIASGDFTGRADTCEHSSTLYQSLAVSINSLAESLARSEQLRREMLANSAHELRTPLTIIQGYLEALRDGVIEPDQRAITSIHEEVLRLVRLVDAVQELERAESRRFLAITRTPTRLDSVADQLLQIMQGSVEHRGIDLRFIPGAGEHLQMVDADSVAQVMRNLLRNALQYTNDGGSIEVRTKSRPSGGYWFWCQNSGQSISPEDLPFIFERFFRTNDARKCRADGAGLGLAICQQLVADHGGTMGADSQDGYTTVWFDLPGR